MYSQANVSAGKWLRPPPRALPSVIVDTEKVLDRTRMERCSLRGAPQKPDGDEPVRSPKNTSAKESQRNSSGIFSQDSQRCSSVIKSIIC